MSTNSSSNSFVGKSAVKVFVAGATIVFGIAITYCVKTGRMPEAGIVTATLVGVYFFAARLYKTV